MNRQGSKRQAWRRKEQKLPTVRRRNGRHAGVFLPLECGWECCQLNRSSDKRRSLTAFQSNYCRKFWGYFGIPVFLDKNFISRFIYEKTFQTRIIQQLKTNYHLPPGPPMFQNNPVWTRIQSVTGNKDVDMPPACQ